MGTRAWRSYGSFDPNSITNLANAKAAGIPYNDVYMFPHRGLSASSQVDEMIKDLSKGSGGNPINATAPSVDTIEARGMRAGYTAKQKADKIWLDEQQRPNLVSGTTKTNTSRIPEWRKEQSVDASYGMIWFDIEVNPSSGCGWGTSYSSNCEYLQELIEAAEKNGKRAGVYSSEYEWETVMGSRDA